MNCNKELCCKVKDYVISLEFQNEIWFSSSRILEYYIVRKELNYKKNCYLDDFLSFKKRSTNLFFLIEMESIPFSVIFIIFLGSRLYFFI